MVGMKKTTILGLIKRKVKVILFIFKLRMKIKSKNQKI